MNTYPTTAEQLYLEQKRRNDNNPGVIEFRKSMDSWRKKNRPLTEEQEKVLEEDAEKFKKEQIAGFESRRYDFPEYHWWMIQDGKKYYRSSKNLNVYDYAQSSVIVGTWNEVKQRIEFCNDQNKKVQELEELISNLTASNV